MTALVQAVDKWSHRKARGISSLVIETIGKKHARERCKRRCPRFAPVLWALTWESIILPMSFLRFLMLLALVVWVGGIVFLAFVEAPTAFSPGLLPTRHLAGSIVGRSLSVLHAMGIISGFVFLIASMIYCRMSAGNARPLALRHLLIVLMLALTMISQFAISPRMHALRAQAVVIDTLPLDSPVRAEFDRLHVWSENFESAVLLLGLIAVFRTAQELR